MLLVLMMALTGEAGEAVEQAGPPAGEPMHLVLLAGQSNMAGRGEVAPEDLVAHPRVWMLDESGAWVPAVEPVHFDIPSLAGVGLGRTFAIRYAEANPGVHVGLIPTAEGGSPIESWQPGGVHGKRQARPYDTAVERTHHAQRTGRLVAILWHQGESDCNADDAPHHHDRLVELIARFRADLEAADVPILIGQLGQFRDPPFGQHARQVDATHRAVADADPLIGFVPSDGLTDKGDELHFDAESYRTFGERYFDVFEQLGN